LSGRANQVDNANLAHHEAASPELKKALGKQVGARAMLKFLAWAVLALLGIATAVGLTTLAQLGTGKNELARLKGEMTALNERVARLEKNIAQLSSKGPASAPPAPPATIPMDLTNDEASLVRNFIKLPPPSPGVTPSIGIGDLVPEGRLMPLPEVVLEKIPKLRGARFTTDRNQAIVIVGNRNRAQAIIGPN